MTVFCLVLIRVLIIHRKNEGATAGPSQPPTKRSRDGIELLVEDDEEILDYVDDVIDGEEFGVEPFQMEEVQVLQDQGHGQANAKASENKKGNKESSQKVAQELTDDKLRNLPRVKSLFEQFWEEKMKEIGGKGEENTKKLFVSNESGKRCRTSPMVKSPSNTTIYVPALAKNQIQIPAVMNPLVVERHAVEGTVVSRDKEITVHVPSNGCDNVNQIISDFVDNLRVEHDSGNGNGGEASRLPDVDDDGNLLVDHERRRASVCADNGFEEAQSRAKKAVLKAERFKATVANPGMDMGKFDNLQVDYQQSGFGGPRPVQQPTHGAEDQLGKNIQILDIGSGVSDDDFFHLTCHI